MDIYKMSKNDFLKKVSAKKTQFFRCDDKGLISKMDFSVCDAKKISGIFKNGIKKNIIEI